MKPQVVSFHCVLKNSLGTLISTTFSQDVITAAAEPGSHLPGFTRKLKNLKEGERRRIPVDAKEAYGLYDPALLMKLPRSHLSKKKRFQLGEEIKLEVGSQLRTYRVIEVTGHHITLDANHPLAGQDLVFEIEVTAARNATAGELLEMAEPPSYLH